MKIDPNRKITTKEVRAYLFSDLVIDQADDRPSNGNPALAKGQAWMLFVNAIAKDPNDAIVNEIIVQNIVREFGEPQ